jgi:hypothetical protein
MKKSITKSQLEATAKEFNKLMALQPQIETGRKTTKAKLQSDIIEASGELVNGEHLTDATLLVLTELGIAHPSKPVTVTTTDKEPEPNQVPHAPEVHPHDRSHQCPKVRQKAPEQRGVGVEGR